MIHSIKEDGTLQLEAFKKDQIDDAYSNMKFPAKIVNAYKLDNVLFISKNLFPNHDLETLAVSDISTTPHNSIYDDVALLAFTVNNKTSSNTNKKYDKIIEIAQESSNNSRSRLYKHVMSDLIESTLAFKGKSIGEIKDILNKTR